MKFDSKDFCSWKSSRTSTYHQIFRNATYDSDAHDMKFKDVVFGWIIYIFWYGYGFYISTKVSFHILAKLFSYYILRGLGEFLIHFYIQLSLIGYMAHIPFIDEEFSVHDISIRPTVHFHHQFNFMFLR